MIQQTKFNQMIEQENHPNKRLTLLKTEIKELLAKVDKQTGFYARNELLNWGHVGSLEYVKKELTRIIKFLNP
ncbi:MAG: hypothetical protein KF856_05245 [Cyclobacteriaceae bacterium]|nr:hypothetical protein [Cyclobacteriaceae bacterium]